MLLLNFVQVYPISTTIVYTLIILILYTKFLHDEDIEQEEERMKYKTEIAQLKKGDKPKIKEALLEILGRLYEHKYDTIEYDYETVDDFYTFLGYDLQVISELQKIGIESTSDLQEQLSSRPSIN